MPRQRTLTLPAGKWAVASPLKYRICNGSEWFFEMEAAPARQAARLGDEEPLQRHRLAGRQPDPAGRAIRAARGSAACWLSWHKRDMLLHGPAHCFNLFLRAEDYMADHPEWFGLRDGKRVPQTFAGAQFCWSNAEARRQFIDNVEAFARQAPQIHILCLVPFDGGMACECDECKQAGASNLLMTLMGEMIERLKACRPDLLVETVGGYGPVTDPPDTAQIHPQQRVVWAHWGRLLRMRLRRPALRPEGQPREMAQGGAGRHHPLPVLHRQLRRAVGDAALHDGHGGRPPVLPSTRRSTRSTC